MRWIRRTQANTALAILSLTAVVLYFSNNGKSFIRTRRSLESIEFEELERKRELFVHLISPKEQDMMFSVLKAFVKVIPADLTYFIVYGTLLGSFRHHGMIPWDRDIDVMVKLEDKLKLMKILSERMPGYKSYLYRKTMIKIIPWYANDTKWPNLDIFFYVENSTHIWDVKYIGQCPNYTKTDVFPLTTRKFMGINFPAPAKAEKVLTQLYGDLDICKTRNFTDTKLGHFSTTASLPCHYLKDKFYFVT